MTLRWAGNSRDAGGMPWLLIDGNWLAYKTRWTLGRNWDPGSDEMLVYGVLDQLRRICLDDRCQSNKVMMFFDSSKSNRRKVFAGYKRSRHKGDLEERKAFRRQLAHLRKEVLPSIGVEGLVVRGFEADDLIASACICKPPFTTRAIVITADRDLFQCISSSVHWYDVGRGRYYNLETFRDEKGINPLQWPLVLSLSGCSSDDIPGIRGIGEKTAIRHIRNESIPVSKLGLFFNAGVKELVDRNRRLVTLPFEGCPNIQLMSPGWQWSALERLASRMPSLIEGNRGAGWKKVMTGVFSSLPLQRLRVRRKA